MTDLVLDVWKPDNMEHANGGRTQFINQHGPDTLDRVQILPKPTLSPFGLVTFARTLWWTGVVTGTFLVDRCTELHTSNLPLISGQSNKAEENGASIVAAPCSISA